MADLLQSASGWPVEVDYVNEEQAHKYIANPDKAPDVAKESAFPPNLGHRLGNFRRHPSQVHNDFFPEVKTTLSSEWLAQTVGKKAMQA
ncbi:hypothetical protein JCM10207_002930 [Rhodosporidiobolus poonsookiae]